jgi:hypothetical protein
MFKCTDEKSKASLLVTIFSTAAIASPSNCCHRASPTFDAASMSEKIKRLARTVQLNR